MLSLGMFGSDPAADVVWLKDNKILSLSDASRMDQRSVGITYTRNRGGLYFRALNESQAGLYTCIFDDLVKMLFELETQEPVTEAPIPGDASEHHVIPLVVVSFN